MTYQLRPYQQDLISKIAASWFEHGNRRVMAQMPTGAGKTIVLSSIVKDFSNRGLKVLVLAHRQELVNQAVEKIEAIVDEPVGVIMAGVTPNYDRDIQVGSVQSMARRMESCPHLDLIVIDECFPAGTLVDSKPIESLQIGDIVNSFNEITGQIEQKPIVRLFKKLSSSKVSVNAGGIEIECTEEHPFFTKRGWIAANQLTTEDYLYVSKLSTLPEKFQTANGSDKSISRKGNHPMLLESMLEGLQVGSSSPPVNQAVHGVFGGFPSNITTSASIKKTLLLDSLWQKSYRTSIVDNVGGNKPQTCFSTNDSQQSNEQFGNSIEDVRYTQENRTQAICTGREWQRRNSPTTNTIRRADGIVKWMGDGVYCQNETEARQWIPFSLQNRYCESSGKNSSGNRWGISFGNSAERAGLKKNGILEWVSVESIEIHQQSSDGRLGERFVYNIEVLDNHNYFVENVLVHNCHHSCSASYTKITDRYPDAKVLGVTATPVRLDGKGFRGVFDDLITGVTVEDLIENQSLCSYKYYACEKPMSVLGLTKRGGDFKAEDIEKENPVEVVANQVYESYSRHLPSKQAVIFATSVAHSIAITEHLRSIGIRAHHLDGMSHNDERKSAMSLFRNREIQILSNCGLFDEGLDIPSIDGVILARPTASLSRYLQMVGRALRPCEGKERAIVIDLADNYERHGMPCDDREWTLDGIPKKQKQRKESKRERNPITNEIETISLFNTGTEYVEIAGKTVVLTPELIEWMRLADSIIAEGIERDFKPGWAAHRLLASDIQPPIEAWRYLGKKLGYHVGWHKYKHEEWIQNHGKKD